MPLHDVVIATSSLTPSLGSDPPVGVSTTHMPAPWTPVRRLSVGFDVSWSLYHPSLSMRSPVLAMRLCGLVVCSSRTLSVRSAPSSWRRCGADARRPVGGGAWGTQEHRLRLMGLCSFDHDGG